MPKVDTPKPEPELPENPDLEWAKNESQINLDALLNAAPSQHDLYQEGPYIKCSTPGHNHGHHIGVGKTLTKDPQTGRLIIVTDTIVTSTNKPAKRQWRHNRQGPIARV